MTLLPPLLRRRARDLVLLPVVLLLGACAVTPMKTGVGTAGSGGAGMSIAGALAPTATAPATLPGLSIKADEAEAVAAAPQAASAASAASTEVDADASSDEGVTDADPAPASNEPAPAVLPPYDPLQPDSRVNLGDTSARTDLWQRVIAGFGIPNIDGPAVKEWEQWYASRPDYVARMTARGSRYLYHITQEVEKRHMPTELALLPFTESAFNPQATSVAKATGMWQFISSTGRDYDLTQNLFRDDRRDVLASTRAALEYLDKLHTMFGDWQLALAAYNCGEGTVQRAIARNKRKGLPTDYQSLDLPAETRGYVPKLQAVKNIVTHPDRYGLALPPLGNHPYFLSVPIERDIDVDTAARLAKISLDEFRMLNPQLNRPVILAAGTPQVLLPYDNAGDFVRAVQEHKGPLATWTVRTARKTLRPADVARQVGMSESEFRQVNQIPPRMLIKAGSSVLVPRTASHTEDVSEQVAENAEMTLSPDLPPTRRVNLRVGRHGDSVLAVARRWHLSAGQVASWNHMSAKGRFAPGATAVLFLPRHSALASRGASRATRVASARGGHRAAPTAHRAAPTAHRAAPTAHRARHVTVARSTHHKAATHVASRRAPAHHGARSGVRVAERNTPVRR